jgi:hypothetical protein
LIKNGLGFHDYSVVEHHARFQLDLLLKNYLAADKVVLQDAPTLDGHVVPDD